MVFTGTKKKTAAEIIDIAKHYVPTVDTGKIEDAAIRTFGYARSHDRSLDSERHIGKMIESMREACERELKRLKALMNEAYELSLARARKESFSAGREASKAKDSKGESSS